MLLLLLLLLKAISIAFVCFSHRSRWIFGVRVIAYIVRNNEVHAWKTKLKWKSRRRRKKFSVDQHRLDNVGVWCCGDAHIMEENE